VSRIEVEHSRGSYQIIIEAGVADQLPQLVSEVAPDHSPVLLIDGNVDRLYPSLFKGVERVLVLPGEEHKTRGTWATITDQLQSAGYDRRTVVVAIGGGVTTDIAGFVAGTFLRGVPWVAVPTTTLAMCDAAVGGKTGVDTQHGKNLVGLFHQPSAVVADPKMLTTLSDDVFVAGLAEAVKHASIVDEEHFGWLGDNATRILQREADVIAQLVAVSCRIKAGVVQSDERESGMRAILNAGHTIGHALEHASGFELSHGQAVAIGLVTEARLGEERGVTASGTADRISGLLAEFGLPTEPPTGIEPSGYDEALRADKKNREGSVRVVLLQRIGAVARQQDGGWTWAVE
jgi:3-dehydroquinate synthase